MEKLKLILIAFLLATPLLLPERAQAQQTQAIGRCVSNTNIVPGGFTVSRCYNGNTVGGIGTTLDDAVANANAMSSLLSQGIQCTYNTGTMSEGMFMIAFACSKESYNFGRAGSVGGVGTTFTDAGLNALTFAQLFAASDGYRCNHSSADIGLGGYITKFNCGYPNTDGSIGRSSLIAGVGSTATDSAINNAGFAELGASGIICSTSGSSISINAGAYKVRFSCNGQNVYGFGSTLTSAGRDALLQAQSQGF